MVAVVGRLIDGIKAKGSGVVVDVADIAQVRLPCSFTAIAHNKITVLLPQCAASSLKFASAVIVLHL